MKKFEVCLHPTKIYDKDTADKLAGKIVNELPSCERKVTLSDFFQAVDTGQSWCGGFFSPKRKIAKNWIRQSVYAIDVDNKGEKRASILELVDHYTDLGVSPNLSYHSLSSSAKRIKFRLVWVTDRPIVQPIKAINFKRWLIENSLGYADPCTINLDRFYFGGRIARTYSNDFLNTENLPQLVEKPKETISSAFVSDKIEDMDFYLHCINKVEQGFRYPSVLGWGSRHMTIWKGAMLLTLSCNASKTSEDIYSQFKKWMIEYPRSWKNYDRTEETILGWIERSRKWTIENLLNAESS